MTDIHTKDERAGPKLHSAAKLLSCASQQPAEAIEPNYMTRGKYRYLSFHYFWRVRYSPEAFSPTPKHHKA